MKRLAVLGVVLVVTVAVSGVFAGEATRTLSQEQNQQQLPDGSCECECNCYCDGPNGDCDCLHAENHYEFRWWYEYSGGKVTDDNATSQSGQGGPDEDWMMFMLQYCFGGGE